MAKYISTGQLQSAAEAAFRNLLAWITQQRYMAEPASEGSAGQVLSTDGAGRRSWRTVAGSGGAGIASVEQTTTSAEDGGTNIITMTLTDDTTATFSVKNGRRGSAGEQGPAGEDGYTPVKGTDYWTDADKTEMLTYLADNLTAADIGAIPSSGRNVVNANIAFGAITNGLIAEGTIEVSKLSASAVTSLVNSVLAALPVWNGGNY